VRALRLGARVSALADSRFRLAALVGVVVVVVDQATKALIARSMVLHETIHVAPFFAFTYLRNTGAAFGVLAGAPAGVRLPLLVAVTFVALAALVSFLRRAQAGERWLVGALGTILGGALGNLICRIRYGEVIDFLDLHWGDLHWPPFNVADSAITVGVIIVLLHGWRARPS
jgi:signal peptidase II